MRDLEKLLNRARAAILVPSHRSFNDPTRVQQLTDLIVELCNTLEAEEQQLVQAKALYTLKRF